MYKHLVRSNCLIIQYLDYVLSLLDGWANYMETPTTSGSTGNAQVGSSTLASVINGWSIPEEFRDQAIQSVNLLVLAATEGSYSAQAFVLMFNQVLHYQHY